MHAFIKYSILQCSPSVTMNLCSVLHDATLCAARTFPIHNRLARALHNSSALDTHNGDGKSKGTPKQMLFLGTPDFSADVLRELVLASHKPDAGFQVAAVVTRSGMPHAHQGPAASVALSHAPEHALRRAVHASPVEAVARDLGVTRVLRPPNAREESFLRVLEEQVQPELCVTAAYGCMLPQRFLDLPRLGTLNIHPSLLPKYRGAAPVQRALQDGVKMTGVSLAYSVLKCDAGPVLAQARVHVEPHEAAPTLTHRLFMQGAKLLLDHMPQVLSGQGLSMAVPQDESRATHAAKLSREEGLLDLSQPASVIHNQVRALQGWPGTRATLLVQEPPAATRGDSDSAQSSSSSNSCSNSSIVAGQAKGDWARLDVKVLRTRVVAPASPDYSRPRNNCSDTTQIGLSAAVASRLAQGRVVLVDGRMLVPCGQNTLLEVLQIRHAGQRRGSSGGDLSGRDFMAGLSRRLVITGVQGTVA